MNRVELENLICQIEQGTVDRETGIEKIASQLATPQSRDTAQSSGHELCLDLERSSRCGFSEAIYAPGKSPDLILEAFSVLHQQGEHALATRVEYEQAETVCANFPETIYHRDAKTLRLMNQQKMSEEDHAEQVKSLILTAGSTDKPVAEEAAETLRWMGQAPELIFDVGVAGPHRLLKHVTQLQQAKVIIVVAGMEGALPSVVGGWVACPVVAVPTSVGYGTNFAGVSALLSMLNSCAANVCTVNIDAGFKAGYLAGVMLKQMNE